MTPQDTLVHLRTMRAELLGKLTAHNTNSAVRTYIPLAERGPLEDRIKALNSAIAMIELGTWVDPKSTIWVAPDACDEWKEANGY